MTGGAATGTDAGATRPLDRGGRLRGRWALGQVQLTLDGEPLLPVAVKPTVAVAPGASVPS